MNLSDEFFSWIQQHATDDPARLRLKMRGKLVGGLDASAAILQIECRRKYAAKFADTLAADPRFYFPGGINAEQATSDRLAGFHASLIEPGKKVADLTSGLGIDAMHLARKSDAVIAIERQPEVADALAFNAANSGIDNLEALCADCRDWLNLAGTDSQDCLFIDPARRADDGSRVYALRDCQPDLTILQERMLQVAPRYIAKLSPMLDISHVLSELDCVRNIMAVGTTTECKELVVTVERGYDGEPVIQACTIHAHGIQCEAFTASDEQAAVATYGMPEPGNVLFEPGPAVMKAAPLKLLSQRYGLTKLAANTQLYFTKKQTAAPGILPGNCLDIIAVLPYSSSEIKRFARRWPKASVTARNFGVQADALRRKLGVRDGGDVRVFAVSDNRGERRLIVAS